MLLFKTLALTLFQVYLIVCFKDSVLFKNLVKLLDTKMLPSGKDSVHFGDTEIAVIQKLHFFGASFKCW